MILTGGSPMIGEETQYHIQCRSGDVGRFCILPGDPGRCEKIARYLDDARFVISNREFTVYTGTLEGCAVSVVSTGIGGPSAAIAMEELIHIGADTFLRVGTCGGIDIKVLPGDLVIAMSAVRQEGTSYEYAPAAYPATADFDSVCALRDAALHLGMRHHVGVVQAKDSFYGQHSPATMPVGPRLTANWEAYKQLGVLASEMESAALFVVAACRHVRCGSVFLTVWNQERQHAGLEQDEVHDTDGAIRCAVEATKLLIRQDRQNGRIQ